MATLSRAESKDMYSWWWDSHISPKNSKWLQENLSDMDSKVRMMIKLIEVDEDSFARRAEMYYKKRPELMKLVEEFYRVFRALAERYDHATGVIRQAHRTMAEAFPNQVPFLITEDDLVNSTDDSDPRTPDMRAPVRASYDPGELQKGAVGLSLSDFHVKADGDFTNESLLINGRKGSRELNGFGKARKGLNFHEVEEKQNVESRVLSESERLGKSETDLQAIKEALAKLEAEKEAGLLQYQQTLERLSKLESEVSRAKEDSRGLDERASKAEAEVQNLKETLAKAEDEREASLLQYQQCVEKISHLESHISRVEQDAGQLNHRACKAEKEVEIFKEELARVTSEKEVLLAKYMEALEKIASLENKLSLAEDCVSRTSERADRAEREVETLRETMTRLTEEKEVAVLKYEQCLEKIATLEREITLVQEEAERLKAEVQDGVAKLEGTQEQCLLLDRSNKSLRSEVDSLTQKVRIQTQELSERQKELSRLWTCLQEERMRFIDSETAFQALRNLHSKVQEELRSVAAELQKKVRLLKDVENQKQQLEDEVEKVKDENKSLNDLNLSSAISLKSMQEENFVIKEGKVKLEQELVLRHDQRNGLQQEINCLKEELNDLSQRHGDMLHEVESAGFDRESFGSLVRRLLEENSELKESCWMSKVEMAALAEKLEIMEKLIEKNALLENSLLDLSSELEGAREKVKSLEESCEFLMGEKSTLAAEKASLVTQLEITTWNLEKLGERNTSLENSLFRANAELAMLRTNSKNLEDSCRVLNDENTILLTEKQTLASELETTHRRLEDLGKRHSDLEQRYSGLEEERKSTLRRVEELQAYLDDEKQEHANSSELSQSRVADLESQISLLQEAGDHMREEFEEELDKAVNAQFEIFILQKCIRDLKEKNSSLLRYCEKLLEASKFSEKLISELELERLEQKEEVSVLSSQISGLRMGMLQLLDVLGSDAGPVIDSCDEEDQRVLHHILGKLDHIKTSVCKALDENQELVIQKSVLLEVLWRLKQDVADLSTEIITLREETGVRNEQLLVLQMEMQKLLENNEELILKVKEGNKKEHVLLTEMENLREKLLNLQGAYKDLQKENDKVVEEKESLMKTLEDLEEEYCNLKHDCSCMVGEAVSLDSLSFIFRKVISEKSMEVIQLTENIDELCSKNGLLEDKVRTVESKLEELRTESFNLKDLLKMSEDKVEEVRVANDQLKNEIANGKVMLCSKEKELLEAEAIKGYQEKQIYKLSENYAQQLGKCEHLCEFIQNLDAQILKMREEHEENEVRVGALSSELQKGKDEVKLWETVAGTFFAELQSSSLREALVKEKFAELMKAFEIVEKESYFKDIDVLQLRERVAALEGENSEMKDRLAADVSAILSLKDSVASLEKHTILQKKLHETHNMGKEVEDAGICLNLDDDKVVATLLGRSIDWQDVLARIHAVEKAVIELKQQAEEERSGVRFDLDKATRQIEALKSQRSSRHSRGRLSKRFPSHPLESVKNGPTPTNGHKPQRASPAVSEPRDELLMKDILLDQVSDCSSCGKNRRVIGSDDRILELWETMDQAGSIDLTVGKCSHLEAVKENKSGRPSSVSMAEKELGVDEQESSKRFPKPDIKRKTLQRLASDVQKLTNLQITVQDLKPKLEMAENYCNKGRGVECDGIKDQLLETEKTISKLFDYSGKLMKKMESSSSASSLDGASAVDSSDGASFRRRIYSEQARRISEKIGKLQLEVQKVQFLLMKLDNNKTGKVGTRITERSTRILLRDFLYGGGSKTPRRRKKTHFCGCVQPPTKGD